MISPVWQRLLEVYRGREAEPAVTGVKRCQEEGRASVKGQVSLLTCQGIKSVKLIITTAGFKKRVPQIWNFLLGKTLFNS